MDTALEVIEKAKQNKNLSPDKQDLIEKICKFMKILKIFDVCDDKEEIIKLGKILNIKQNELNDLLGNYIERYIENPEKKEIKSLNDKIYIFSSSCIPYIISIPSNLLIILVNNNKNKYDEINPKSYFEINYNKFALWNEIYLENGYDGLAKYCSLNKKIKKRIHSDIIDLYMSNELSKKEILKLTSDSYDKNDLIKRKKYSNKEKNDIILL